MRAIWAAVLAGALVLPAPALADQGNGSVSPDRGAATSAAKKKRNKRLNLGPFADPYARVDDETLAELLRFEQHVEVHGEAPKDLQASMALWWDHFNFEYSVYGRGYNVQKPVHPGAINILPLLDWVKDKIKQARQNRSNE